MLKFAEITIILVTDEIIQQVDQEGCPGQWREQILPEGLDQTRMLLTDLFA